MIRQALRRPAMPRNTQCLSPRAPLPGPSSLFACLPQCSAPHIAVDPQLPSKTCCARTIRCVTALASSGHTTLSATAYPLKHSTARPSSLIPCIQQSSVELSNPATAETLGGSREDADVCDFKQPVLPAPPHRLLQRSKHRHYSSR